MQFNTTLMRVIESTKYILYAAKKNVLTRFLGVLFESPKDHTSMHLQLNDNTYNPRVSQLDSDVSKYKYLHLSP